MWNNKEGTDLGPERPHQEGVLIPGTMRAADMFRHRKRPDQICVGMRNHTSFLAFFCTGWLGELRNDPGFFKTAALWEGTVH